MLYVSLAASFSKGQLDLAAIQQRLDDVDLRRWAQAEDVKMQLRNAFIATQLLKDDSGICSALVGREVALRCLDRDIFYGMEFGSADAVAAADYVAALLLLRQGRVRDTLPWLEELAHIAAEKEDLKGAVEAFAMAGMLNISLEDYGDAATGASLICRTPHRIY